LAGGRTLWLMSEAFSLISDLFFRIASGLWSPTGRKPPIKSGNQDAAPPPPPFFLNRVEDVIGQADESIVRRRKFAAGAVDRLA